MTQHTLEIINTLRQAAGLIEEEAKREDEDIQSFDLANVNIKDALRALRAANVQAYFTIGVEVQSHAGSPSTAMWTVYDGQVHCEGKTLGQALHVALANIKARDSKPPVDAVANVEAALHTLPF